FAVDGLYCTYILNFSSGSLINWYKNKILHNFNGDNQNFFEYIEEDMDRDDKLMLLPYFAGAATPFQDNDATGAILGLTLNTTDKQIYRAMLEGTSFEMKLNLDIAKKFGITVDRAVATGGGSNSKNWLQIKSDILGITLESLRSSEGGLCGVALLQAVAMGVAKDLEEAKGILVRYKDKFQPNADTNYYDKKYEKYKKLYKTIKEI
ncbi:MAG: hypothetical protein E7369_05345, partial [Clostridiales bacterium]|nr:hypothetical protein [Clostridiales bacterium]